MRAFLHSDSVLKSLKGELNRIDMKRAVTALIIILFIVVKKSFAVLIENISVKTLKPINPSEYIKQPYTNHQPHIIRSIPIYKPVNITFVRYIGNIVLLKAVMDITDLIVHLYLTDLVLFSEGIRQQISQRIYVNINVESAGNIITFTKFWVGFVNSTVGSLPVDVRYNLLGGFEPGSSDLYRVRYGYMEYSIWQSSFSFDVIPHSLNSTSSNVDIIHGIAGMGPSDVEYSWSAGWNTVYTSTFVTSNDCNIVASLTLYVPRVENDLGVDLSLDLQQVLQDVRNKINNKNLTMRAAINNNNLEIVLAGRIGTYEDEEVIYIPGIGGDEEVENLFFDFFELVSDSNVIEPNSEEINPPIQDIPTIPDIFLRFPLSILYDLVLLFEKIFSVEGKTIEDFWRLLESIQIEVYGNIFQVHIPDWIKIPVTNIINYVRIFLTISVIVYFLLMVRRNKE